MLIISAFVPVLNLSGAIYNYVMENMIMIQPIISRFDTAWANKRVYYPRQSFLKIIEKSSKKQIGQVKLDIYF